MLLLFWGVHCCFKRFYYKIECLGILGFLLLDRKPNGSLPDLVHGHEGLYDVRSHNLSDLIQVAQGRISSTALPFRCPRQFCQASEAVAWSEHIEPEVLNLTSCTTRRPPGPPRPLRTQAASALATLRQLWRSQDWRPPPTSRTSSDRGFG